MTHTWKYVGNSSQNPMGVDAISLVIGLGFVLSFGYWCTNFLVIQRALAADSMAGSRQTPLIAAFPKIFMPFVVILPGVAAVALMSMGFTYDIYQSYPKKGAPDRHYLRVGRITTIAGVILSVGAAFLATHFNDLMDFLQLIFAFVNAPLFATFTAWFMASPPFRRKRAFPGTSALCRSPSSWA